jgi:RHS repeat-associated protein
MDAQYKYDALGRRIEKNVNGQVTTYVYDGLNMVADYTGLWTVRSKYVFGLGLDEPLSVDQGGNLYYYHGDGLGNVNELTDGSGNVAKTYRYDSFGKISAQTGSLDQPFAFTGREYDAETGLYYYRARYYDPKAGRFISKDPIGFGGGDVNLFRYVGNDPGNWVDPNGESAAASFSSWIAIDLLIPDPSDFAWPKWAIYGLALGGATAIDYVCFSGHSKDKRQSTWDKHSKPRPGGPEKGDDSRRPPRQKPPNHKGPWPPKPKS